MSLDIFAVSWVVSLRDGFLGMNAEGVSGGCLWGDVFGDNHVFQRQISLGGVFGVVFVVRDVFVVAFVDVLFGSVNGDVVRDFLEL